MFKASCALAVGALTALLAAASASAGDRIYGIDSAAPPHVVSFDSGAPGTFLTDVPISGIGAGQAVVGLDSRPLDGSLWLVTINSGVGRLYTVNPATGAATLEQTLSADGADATDPYTTLGTQAYGVDFNPVPDRLRIVGKSDDKSMRVNPATGAVITDATINPPGPGIAGVAYSNPVPGASTTTLFAYDYQNDFVGILNPPNDGTFNVLGNATITAGSDVRTNLDIAPSGVGYATHQIGAGPALFTWSLSTGVHTLVGVTPAGLVGMTASTANLAAVTSTAPTAGEQASSIALTVVRDNPRGTLGLTWSTAPGTAEAGSDYTSMGAPLTFAPGQVSRTVTIPLLDDNADEPNESFTVTFAPTGNQDGTVLVPTATVTLVDDDPSPAAAPDRDGDGVADATDNCPNVSNVDQADGNGNGVGKVCDLSEAPVPPAPDRDADGTPDATDNCPNVGNAGQADGDGDGLGTVCDPSEPKVLTAGKCANVQAGTSKDDSLLGTPMGDKLTGVGGVDSLFGGDGDDCLDGGVGDDWLSGGNGVDDLNGGAGNDTIYGGAGNDKIAGGAGTNVVRAGAGNDTVNTKNKKRETVDCGAGRDTVTADKSDKLKGCETKKR